MGLKSCSSGGLLPLPIGERGGVRGDRSLDTFEPPHPNPLPSGEREHTERVALSLINFDQLSRFESPAMRVAGSSGWPADCLPSLEQAYSRRSRLGSAAGRENHGGTPPKQAKSASLKQWRARRAGSQVWLNSSSASFR